jgi:hypothetical protein
MSCFVEMMAIVVFIFGSAFEDTQAANAQPPAIQSDMQGLWADVTQSWRMIDPSRTWYCSTTGWLYFSSRSVSSEAMTCTTPVGNDLSWAGGVISI